MTVDSINHAHAMELLLRTPKRQVWRASWVGEHIEVLESGVWERACKLHALLSLPPTPCFTLCLLHLTLPELYTL